MKVVTPEEVHHPGASVVYGIDLSEILTEVDDVLSPSTPPTWTVKNTDGTASSGVTVEAMTPIGKICPVLVTGMDAGDSCRFTVEFSSTYHIRDYQSFILHCAER